VRKEKVAFYCNLDKRDVISNPDCDTIYRLPLILREQRMEERVLEKLGMEPAAEPELERWEQLVEKITSEKEKTLRIGIIAKYIASGDDELVDSYKSLIESLEHASWERDAELEIDFINAEALGDEDEVALEALEEVDGIIVPIGWGSRGVDGKLAAIQYAREHEVPYLGLCYGMQLATVEFARNVVGLEDAHTIEVDNKTEHPIIHDIPFSEEYQTIKGDVASMRLGAYDCVLREDSLAYDLYEEFGGFKDKDERLVSERHRHRFEFNNEYREQLAEAGLVFSGTSPDDVFVEMIELPQDEHPFFLATQAHPEYKSRPLQPHPFFLGFLRAVEEHSS
jgi:CTP synthase